MTVPPASEPLGMLGRYELVRVLGRGAMGVVYEGLDRELQRTVAIKTILGSHLLDPREADEYRARFRREAQAAGRLTHPHIVTVFDFGIVDDGAYLVMQFIRGRELAHAFAGGERFTLADSVRLMCELLDALGYAHANGIVHRDIKPANVMIDAHGSVKLTDFGVARLADAGTDRTMPGTIVGTPSYMSPEQILGQAVGSRADLFAAGVILYQFITGERPFAAEGAFAVQYRIVNDQPAPPSSRVPGLAPVWDTIIERALAKKPEDRYPDAATFARALHDALTAGDATVIVAPGKSAGAAAEASRQPEPAPSPAPRGKSGFGFAASLFGNSGFGGAATRTPPAPPRPPPPPPPPPAAQTRTPPAPARPPPAPPRSPPAAPQAAPPPAAAARPAAPAAAPDADANAAAARPPTAPLPRAAAVVRAALRPSASAGAAAAAAASAGQAATAIAGADDAAAPKSRRQLGLALLALAGAGAAGLWWARSHSAAPAPGLPDNPSPPAPQPTPLPAPAPPAPAPQAQREPAAAAPPPQPAPAPVDDPPPPVAAPAAQPAPPPAAQPVPPTPAPTPAPAPSPSPAPAPSPPQPRPPAPVPAPAPRPPAPARSDERAAPAPARDPRASSRCSALLERWQIGEPLSADDQAYFDARCKR